MPYIPTKEERISLGFPTTKPANGKRKPSTGKYDPESAWYRYRSDTPPEYRHYGRSPASADMAYHGDSNEH